MSKLPVHVALVSEARNGPGLTELTRVAAALQEQVVRDFAPAWGVTATVAAFPDLKSVPPGYWPIVIKDDLGDPGALGYHTDHLHQPQAFVHYDAGWAQTASHELLEMLADPFGNRLWVANSPYGTERVHILVEVCDPCEEIGYEIGGVKVSDFALPSWYHTATRFGHAYCYSGQISQPRTLLRGGYVSYADSSGHWWQDTWFGTKPESRSLGRFEGFAQPGDSLRQAVDRFVRSN